MNKINNHKTVATLLTLISLVGVIFLGWKLGDKVLAQMTDFGNVDITAVVPSPQTSSGGGVVNLGPVTTITFSGTSAPKSRIVIIRNGQIFNTLYAQDNGAFQVTVNNQPLGLYNFGLYFEDSEGNLSNIVVLQVQALSQTPIIFNNIVLPPTINLSSNIVTTGQTIKVTGYSAPNSTVYISNSQNPNGIVSVISDSQGKYNADIIAGSTTGNFYIRAKTRLPSGIESIYSRNSFFSVLNNNDLPPVDLPPATQGEFLETRFPSCADPNRNNRVNLVDFSIMLFWYLKPNPPANIDCNSDGVVDLRDFSVLMYYWTG